MAKRPSAHEAVVSRKAPKPIGPYSPAIRVKAVGEMLFVSGQIPIEAPTGKVFNGDIKRQAEIALLNLKNIITDAKFTMDEVVKVTIFLTDMKNFEAVNSVYEKQFVGATLPARSVVQVAALPKEVGVEVEAVAVKAGGGGGGADAMFTDDDF